MVEDNIYEFTEYLHNNIRNITEEELEELYDEYIYIEFNHHRVQIPYEAISHNGLIEFLEKLIKEY